MFFQRRQTNVQQVQEKVLNITNHQGNANMLPHMEKKRGADFGGVIKDLEMGIVCLIIQVAPV